MTQICFSAEAVEPEDDPWDVFLSDDDLEPEPELGDFWFEDDQLPFTDFATGVAADVMNAAV